MNIQKEWHVERNRKFCWGCGCRLLECLETSTPINPVWFCKSKRCKE